MNGPSRSLIATAFSSAVCRKRLRLRERSKRLVDLIHNIIGEAKVVEEYNIGPSENSSAEFAEDDDPFAEVFALRHLSDLSANSSANLAGMIGGIADEFAADLEIVEIFNRTPIYDHVAQMVLARPPLSAAALRFFTVAMGQGRAAIDRAVELGVPTWLLQCREASDVSNDFNNNVAATCQAQSCRDDALQILGFAANQQPFHNSCDLFNPAEVLHNLFSLLRGNPSDDAAAAGCRCLEWLIRGNKGSRRSALAASDVHDVLVPLYMSKQDAAKDALAKTLRVVISNEAWLEPALRYFEERGSLQKFDQVIHELNALDELKARDVPEMHSRYTRDMPEMHSR